MSHVTMTTDENCLFLFGGDAPWSAEAWTASDDRVRGGKSQSYLDCPADANKAVFRGTLDITALGGAGFASQRTVDRVAQPSGWDVSAYDGLRLKVLREGGDGKKYTLTLKDEVLPKRPDGREQSTVSWEYDFISPTNDGEDGGSGDQVLYVPWSDFKPTYRGKPKPDAPELDLAHVQRISLMMRSFFGKQEGPFRLEVAYIAAVKGSSSGNAARPRSIASSYSSTDYPEKGGGGVRSEPKSWMTWMCGLFK
ncbi:complex I intermediate-associated protein 30 [Apiospora arundinis]